MSQPPEPVDTFSLLRPRDDDPPNIRALRLAVLGMGALMVVGFGVVIARIVYLTTRPPAVSDSPTPAVGPQTQAKPGPDTTLALPADAKVLSQSLSGTRLSVHYAAGGDESIVILDLETGQPISRIRISSGKK